MVSYSSSRYGKRNGTEFFGVTYMSTIYAAGSETSSPGLNLDKRLQQQRVPGLESIFLIVQEHPWCLSRNNVSARMHIFRIRLYTLQLQVGRVYSEKPTFGCQYDQVSTKDSLQYTRQVSHPRYSSQHIYWQCLHYTVLFIQLCTQLVPRTDRLLRFTIYILPQTNCNSE